MRLFLFAIGGTGARVVRSLTMMLASGVKGLDSSTEIIPIIIDYDLSNGDKTRAKNALMKYSAIHNALYPDALQGQLYDDHFFMTKVRPLSQAGWAHVASPNDKDYEFNFGPAGNTMKFSDYLKMLEMRTNPSIQLTEDLLKALYDNSSSETKDAELELDMAKGFKGNPNIGSVVFHNLRDMPEFDAFKNTFNEATDRVFIVSSIFGGTGASGFPEIVNAIRTSPLATLNPAIIGSAVVLPYFDLGNYTPANGDTGAIDAGSFNAKTRAALGFYASNNGINARVNAIYYIGDETHDKYQYNEGESRQQNDAHVVEFVAATSVIDFMFRTGFAPHHAIQPALDGQAHQAFEFEIQNDKIKGSIELPDFEQSTHSLVLDDLSTFAIAMKYYRDVVCGDREKISKKGYNSDTRFNLNPKLGNGFYAMLDEFLLSKNNWGFYRWLDELNGHAHKLHLYRLDKKEKMKKVLAHKEISVAIGNNPIKDAMLNEAMDKASTKLNRYDEQSFLKILRDVVSKKYQIVR